MTDPIMSNETIIRRSANYRPPIWDFDFVQSLKSEFVGELNIKRIDKLKEDVKMMLNKTMAPSDQLELIDTLQRLGLAYHFGDEIKRIVKSIYNSHRNDNTWMKEDLHTIALQFRLLRQHGYNISQEIFDIFRDELGNFKECLHEDIEGMLSLYEASYLLEEGENILEVAREFAASCLKKYIQVNKDQLLSMIVSHSLEVPLHWRMPRLETRWFIDIYEKKQGMNPLLLELAKLDFNNVQATYHEDLKYVTSWWRNTGLGEKLSFARDRLMENFLWTVGVNFPPQFGYFRRISTKVNSLITVIDDIYDVYGTLDELQLFTNAVERWDVNAMDQLPEYMKLCFLALHNSINEMAYDALREQGFHIIPYLKKAWADLCKSYLVEAKWYYIGYTPTLQEYMDNAWISISAPVILVHAYFLEGSPITNEALKSLKEYPDIIQWSSMILRFADDLGTSSDELKRGDNPKSIQCYIYETGVSELKAREHIQYLIGETWKKINKEREYIDSPFSKIFIEVATNLARMAQCMYQHGDGHGIEDGETKDHVLSLLVKPIPM
ncbi:terpene synthase 10 [Ricinus communis]|uniref:terpene synthase 10 n=1 Tax=Ricinus communis TaxID=3988 RepID=UPI00022CCE7C|nr:terpene synthase 10 [Ricinus communis]AEQ27769.1 sesquiterpene synthase [Ricinus communis]|eukprot:NP_001310631.1 terpene synthase 10 [Ricinus communis]